jgi:hypothetical protein
MPEALRVDTVDQKDEEMGGVVAKGVIPDITNLINAVVIMGMISKVVEAMRSTNAIVLGTSGIETVILNEIGSEILNQSLQTRISWRKLSARVKKGVLRKEDLMHRVHPQ